jgi:hypothetical protein
MRLAAALVAALLMQPADAAFRVLDRGGQSGVEEARQVVVTSSGQFATLWRQHSARPQPAVDFSKESVVGIFLGTRMTAGYSVEMVSITRSASGTVVRCREVGPPADAVTAQVLTFPYILVAAPVISQPVRFECAR